MSETAARIAGILANPLCWCGRSKHGRHAVCRHCWGKLGEEPRDSLHLRGRDFLTGYERALDELSKRVRKAKAVPRKPAAPVIPFGRYKRYDGARPL